MRIQLYAQKSQIVELCWQNMVKKTWFTTGFYSTIMRVCIIFITFLFIYFYLFSWCEGSQREFRLEVIGFKCRWNALHFLLSFGYILCLLMHKTACYMRCFEWDLNLILEAIWQTEHSRINSNRALKVVAL